MNRLRYQNMETSVRWCQHSSKYYTVWGSSLKLQNGIILLICKIWKILDIYRTTLVHQYHRYVHG